MTLLIRIGRKEEKYILKEFKKSKWYQRSDFYPIKRISKTYIVEKGSKATSAKVKEISVCIEISKVNTIMI